MQTKRILFSDIKTIPVSLNTVTPQVTPQLIQFSLEGADLAGFMPTEATLVSNDQGILQAQMSGWPSVDISFAVPASEMSLVQGWFNGDLHLLSASPSSTLQRQMTTAVRAALENYIANAEAFNCLTTPCRAAFCFRFNDGTRSQLSAPTLLAQQPTAPAPLLPIFSHSIGDKELSTTVSVRNIPSQLRLQLNQGVVIPANLAEVEIYLSVQQPVFPSTANVNGVRSIVIDGVRKRCWHYDSFPTDSIIAGATNDTTFHRVASIPVQELSNFSEASALALPPCQIGRIASLPKYSEHSATPDWQPELNFETEALNLDAPGWRKSIRYVKIEGTANPKAIKLELWGSETRRHWRRIAATTGPTLGPLWGARLRWIKLRVYATLQPGEFIDAASITFHKNI